MHWITRMVLGENILSWSQHEQCLVIEEHLELLIIVVEESFYFIFNFFANARLKHCTWNAVEAICSILEAKGFVNCFVHPVPQKRVRNQRWYPPRSRAPSRGRWSAHYSCTPGPPRSETRRWEWARCRGRSWTRTACLSLGGPRSSGTGPGPPPWTGWRCTRTWSGWACRSQWPCDPRPPPGLQWGTQNLPGVKI